MTNYFIFIDQSATQPGLLWSGVDIEAEVWAFDGSLGKRLDIVDTTGGTDVRVEAHEDFRDALKRRFPARFLMWDENDQRPHDRRPYAYELRLPWELHELRIEPRRFYPRIARPRLSYPFDYYAVCPVPRQYENEIASLRGQYNTLVRRLVDICEVIYPFGPNLNAYGHDIRNLIILACTELETSWRAILEENGIAPINGKPTSWSTKDFIKLLDPLKLREYEIFFPDYPWLPPFNPFKDWDRANPTKSLAWYDAYNQVKHDREKHFEQAKLEYAFMALSACAVMLFAQFGKTAFIQSGALRFVEFRRLPRWELTETYVDLGLAGRTDWSAVLYPL
jgi:hypothetical protein